MRKPYKLTFSRTFSWCISIQFDCIIWKNSHKTLGRKLIFIESHKAINGYRRSKLMANKQISERKLYLAKRFHFAFHSSFPSAMQDAQQ